MTVRFFGIRNMVPFNHPALRRSDICESHENNGIGERGNRHHRTRTKTFRSRNRRINVRGVQISGRKHSNDRRFRRHLKWNFGDHRFRNVHSDHHMDAGKLECRGIRRSKPSRQQHEQFSHNYREHRKISGNRKRLFFFDRQRMIRSGRF